MTKFFDTIVNMPHSHRVLWCFSILLVGSLVAPLISLYFLPFFVVAGIITFVVALISGIAWIDEPKDYRRR